MQVGKKGWPILSMCGLKERIDTQPDYQRPAVWDLPQRQLLIDTILRGYDVPKIYWRKVQSNPDRYEVDDQRLFTHDQRMAIYRRDNGICQVRIKCSGIKCDWDNWEADHKKPWSKGGRTTVANGQVACLACNPSKSDSHAIASA